MSRPITHLAAAADGGTLELDFVFASHALADRLAVRALNADPEEWVRATIAA